MTAGGKIRAELWRDSYLKSLVLAQGNHPDRSNGLCVMEAVAWAAGESHTDYPRCVSPVIGAFLRSWNDGMDETDRQQLKGYVLKVIGTATSEADETRRAWLCTDWLVRVQAPAWLHLAGLGNEALLLTTLPDITSTEAARAAQSTINAAADAAGDAAGLSARAAARAGGDASWAAAWFAAGVDAAWDAARAAAGAAAGDAAYDAARTASAAGGGAVGVAWAAARAAAGAAAGAAAAVWDAAGAALRPTVVALQPQACKLLDEMIKVGK